MTAIIIDDMPQAVELLQRDLSTHCPQVSIIATAHSVIEGAKLLQQQQPDLLFLDIMLGDGTGFDLLEIVPQLNAKVIFVTASDEFALRAFRFAAIDYLLKPIKSNELKAAVERAEAQLEQSSTEQLAALRETTQQPEWLPKRITLHTQESIRLVPIAEIIRCEADGNHTWFHLLDGSRILVTKTLKQFAQQLADFPFLRTHQSHLVHLKYVQAYERKDGGFLLLTNGAQIPVAVRKKAEVIETLDRL